MRIQYLAPLLALAFATAGCGGGGSDNAFAGILVFLEAEGNDSSATANALPSGAAGSGTISVAGDLDFWSFFASAGDVIFVEVAGARLEQAAWDAACTVPELTLFAPDGTTRLLRHDPPLGWTLGYHDMDFPLYRIPAGGVYYVCVGGDNPALAGARYTVTVRRRSLSGVQFEAEASGGIGVNDGPLSAQTIAAGSLFGHHVDTNPDWYKFTITGATVLCCEMVASRNGVSRNEVAYYKPRLNLYAPDGATLLATVDGVFFDDPLLCARLGAAGTYFLEVAQAAAGGDSDYHLGLVLTAIGALPSETEPNGTTPTADGIAYGDNFEGTISSADTDFFTFSGAAGDAILVEVLPATIGTPVGIAFFLPDGTTPLGSDSDAFGGIVSARTILPSTGLFFMRITAVAPAAVTYAASFARRSAARFETEPNELIATADDFDASGRAAGVIAAAGDKDVYRFTAAKDELVICSILATRVVRGGFGSDGFRTFSGHGSTLKPRLRLLRADGTLIAFSTLTPANTCVGAEDIVDGQPTLAVAMVAPASGTFYLEVTAEDGTGSASHVYSLLRR